MSNDRPNILWLMTDEQRCDSLGCYGSAWARTPNLDALAARGVVFETAVTPSPVCQPARVSILTGCHPAHTGVWWNAGKLKRSLFHLTSVFESAGYRTASFGKQHYGSDNPAFQTEVHRTYSQQVRPFDYIEPYKGDKYGMVRYPPEPYPWIFAGRFPDAADQTAEALNIDDAIAWLGDHERSAADQPFFLRVSFNAPHTPVVAPQPYDQCIDPAAIDLPADAEAMPDGAPAWVANDLASAATADRLSKADLPRIRSCYYGLVSYVDAQFGRIIEHLRSGGMLENTIVAFCSDHGTHLGDYGLVQKQTFFEPSVNVPFFFFAPNHIATGLRMKTPVEVLSILPTLLDLAGLDVPPHIDGVSLATALVTGHEPQQRPVFSELTLESFNLRPGHRLVMVRDGDWKLTLCMDPQPGDGSLVNLADDPHERRNLFDAPRHRGVRDRLVSLIHAHLADGASRTPPYLAATA